MEPSVDHRSGHGPRSVALVHRSMTSRSPLRQPAPIGEPVGRRASLAGGIRKLYNDSPPYDGMGYTGADIQPSTASPRKSSTRTRREAPTVSSRGFR
ncbi:MAG: hypothetical protein M3533_03945 [Actinomycetota bacterium]|nr:hypothetical protein [Actinomycetota bacterium]